VNNKKNIIEKALSLLINSDKSGYQIGKDTGITEATIGNYRNEKTKPTVANANILIRYFENNDGSMLNNSDDVKFYEPENAPRNKPLIPLWDDIGTVGGKHEKGYSANLKSSYSSPTEWIDPGDWFKGVTAAMRHYEESMIEYPSGCILALKEVHEWRLLIPGRNYVFDTPEYRVTKKLQEVHDNEFVMVHSTNEEKYDNGKLIHPPFPIPWELIGRIFEVLGYVVKSGSGSMVYTNQK